MGCFLFFVFLHDIVLQHEGAFGKCGGWGKESRVGQGGQEEEGAALPDRPRSVKYACAFVRLSSVWHSVGWLTLALEPGRCVF